MHVWQTQLDVPDALRDALSVALSPEERERASRFLFPAERARFNTGRGVLRHLLGCYLNIAPRDVCFAYSSKGKPRLAPELSGCGLKFNLSHSHGRLLVAVAYGLEVGVDLEWMHGGLDVEEIARRFFSVEEAVELRCLPKALTIEGFFNGWTRKEAYLKARGEGITGMLDQCAVSISPRQPARLLFDRRHPGAEKLWSLCQLDIAREYAGSLAVEGKGFDVRYWEWTEAGAASLIHACPAQSIATRQYSDAAEGSVR